MDKLQENRKQLKTTQKKFKNQAKELLSKCELRILLNVSHENWKSIVSTITEFLIF